MAPEAEAPPPGGPASEASLQTRLGRLLTRGLRFVEGLVFCCLATLLIVWTADRSRDVDFEPVTVEICDAATCMPEPAAAAERVWNQYSEMLDRRGLVVFSNLNTCAFAAEILRARATHDGAPLALDLMQSRGTITLTRPGDGTAILGPGANNDGFGDVMRDALRWQGTRGCHPMRYATVFWPLWTVWMLLMCWRLLRYRQSLWATR